MENPDDRWMVRAIELARRGEGLTRPNPPVGAVGIAANGTVVAEGWHRKAGMEHAEAAALRRAGAAAVGGTLVVTLEPCCTWGRTPPCVDRVIASGVRRVVVGAVDPNPAHRGRGVRRLRRAGLDVVCGPGAGEARALVLPFEKWVVSGRPWLTLKLGTTLDGRIADARGASRWITGPASRKRVQILRRTADAIMVGARTVVADDPSLRPRPAAGRRPLRVIVDAHGRISSRARVLTDGFAQDTVIATTAACPTALQARYARHGAQVWICRSAGGGVSLRDLARRLGRMGVLHVLCEGGGRLAAALVTAGWVDALEWFLAPRMLGAQAVPAMEGPPWSLRSAPGWTVEEVERLGDDIRIRYRPGQPLTPAGRTPTGGQISADPGRAHP